MSPKMSIFFEEKIFKETDYYMTEKTGVRKSRK